MTVCIAAICDDNDEEKIVLCSDRRVGSALGSSDTMMKERSLRHGWKCLTSGTENDINALFRLYDVKFRDEKNLTYAKIDETIKSALFERKVQLAEEYIRARFAISYEEFIKAGKNQLPADLFHDGIQKIAALDLKAEFILAGFINRSAEIYFTESTARANPVTSFAVVGEGEYVASSVLLRRAQNAWDSLECTLYNVYEAKKYSEAVGSVGRNTFLTVLSADGKSRETSHVVDKQLAQLYKDHGAKPLNTGLKFEGDYYYNPKDQ